MTVSLPESTVRDLLLGFADGSLSPVDVTTQALADIKRWNHAVRAFLSVDAEGALAAARQAEARWAAWRAEGGMPPAGDGWQQLPTWGVPVSVKDTIEQAGLPTTYGSLPFATNHQGDALVVSRLRQAGCALLGKTNTSEFALSTVTANRLGPPTRNPWDTTRTAGGSSGGAAAAAALGLGGFALGTDSAGSIRLPAAYCGLYGFKPTHSAVPIRQRWRASRVRSHLGPLARTPEDLVYGWHALTGDDAPLTPLDSRVRVRCAAGDPDHREVLTEALGQFRATGLSRIDTPLVSLPDVPSAITRAGDWVFAGDHLAAAEQLLPNFWQKHGRELTGYARPIYEAGHRIPAWEYRAALDAFEGYRDSVQECLKETDVLITSTAEAPPVVADEVDPTDVGVRYPLLSMWNFTGNPALVVPLAPGTDCLPRAVQLVGQRGDDRLLLRLALTLARVSSASQAVPVAADVD